MVYPSTLLLAAAALLVNALVVQSTSITRRATTCNGDSSLCNRLYSNVTFAGAHNSYAIASNGGTSLASNQNVSLSAQLDAGIRLLQSQAHLSSNTSATGAGIDLCHTSCTLFQGGSLEYYLSQVKTWSDAHPTEVLTLLIVNSDNLGSSQFGQAFQTTGLASKMYQPSAAALTKSQWPTLGALIDGGTPIVGFLASGADSSVPYLLDEFTNIWETPFGQTSTPFNCSVDRPAGLSDPTSIMYLSNQVLDSSLFGSTELSTPDTEKIGTTNSLATTVSTSDSCAAQHGTYPNFILTDYSTVPSYDFMRGVAQLNGVSYTAPARSASSSGSSSDSSSGSSGAATISSSLSSGVLLAGSALMSALVAIAL